MKIVLDMQGAQSNSRHRGIGRFSLSISKAFAKAAAGHDVWLALNGLHLESAAAIADQFDGLIPRERIVACELPSGIAAHVHGNRPRIQLAERAQANFFRQLNADCIWHSSLFEGWGDDFVATLGVGDDDGRSVATLYDLIPALNPSRFMHDLRYRRWYYRRLGLIKRCGLLLAISESSRREAIDYLNLDADRIAVVYGAADSVFHPRNVNESDWSRWFQQWHLRRDFIMYNGGFDAHKNVETLIAAYAQLPPFMRMRFSLLLAGRCALEKEKALQQLGRIHGLSKDQLIFSGEVSDQELATLYSHCAVFVTPSLHEGFGLPPLEAMACGAAVIGSDTSSLPEVIGRDDALFNPRSVSSLATKLAEVLADPSMQMLLKVHAQTQSKKFSWESSAQDALKAIESRMMRLTGLPKKNPRPRLLYVSPLPPARSGIADYSARLLRELATHYDIELVVDQPEVIDGWVEGNFPLHSMEWMLSQSAIDARVLYHIGNSPHHARMFALLKQHPGVVMLHDFYLGSAKNWTAENIGQSDDYLRELYYSHGYNALIHDMTFGRASSVQQYPINLDVITQALGVMVHSAHAVDLAAARYGESVKGKFTIVPFSKEVRRGGRRVARRLLGFAESDFVFCSFGMLAPTKLNHRLLNAWLKSPLATDTSCHLVFVGENDGSDYGRDLVDTIRDAECGVRVHISGFVSAATYSDYLDAADAAVQLRTNTRGETSAAIFDALAAGLPVIVNAHGSASELPVDVIYRLNDEFSDAQLADALDFLWKKAEDRMDRGRRASQWLHDEHHPASVAAKYRDAIEHFSGNRETTRDDEITTDRLQKHADKSAFKKLRELAQINAEANLSRLGPARLYVDVTATSASTLHSGIERVVRSILNELLHSEASALRVEPVRLIGSQFVHSTSYALQLIDHGTLHIPENVAYPQHGDIFLGLDWVADALPLNRPLLQRWRARGARLFFVVYDLLPVQRPEWFPHGIAEMHAEWLRCIGEYAEGIICISKKVAADLRQWYVLHPPRKDGHIRIGYFYLGHDIRAGLPSLGLPADARGTLLAFRDRPSFLMVGTIEPRKGHAFVLDAFEKLWRQGVAARLVVVGRSGWMSSPVVERLKTLSKNTEKLVWLDNASDEYLDLIYGSVRALIAASEGEGFGLPLVEAAYRGLPVIARDIEVFREVSSSFATYFDGNEVDSLLACLRSAIVGQEPALESVLSGVATWRQATGVLQEMLRDENHTQWLDSWHSADSH